MARVIDDRPFGHRYGRTRIHHHRTSSGGPCNGTYWTDHEVVARAKPEQLQLGAVVS